MANFKYYIIWSLGHSLSLSPFYTQFLIHHTHLVVFLPHWFSVNFSSLSFYLKDLNIKECHDSVLGFLFCFNYTNSLWDVFKNFLNSNDSQIYIYGSDFFLKSRFISTLSSISPLGLININISYPKWTFVNVSQTHPIHNPPPWVKNRS